MKKLLLLFAVNCIFFSGIAQNYSINFTETKNTLNGIQINQNDFEKLNLNINYQGVDVLKVKTKKGDFSQLELQGSYRTGKVGNPQLPSSKKLIEIPEGAQVSVKVLSYEIAEYNLADFGIVQKIIPFQPSYPKNVDPTEVAFKINQKTYAKNEFLNQELVQIERMGTLRGVNLAQLTVNPIQYNPYQNTIKVYNNLNVEVTFTNAVKSNLKKDKAYSPYFESIYKNIINSKDNFSDNPDHTKYPIKYLIVTAPEFETQMADFVDWKTKKGFEVLMVTTDEIGTSVSEIKAWIHGQYNAGTDTDPAPTFFLLVGDTDQIPASQIGDDSGKATDLYYACVDGTNDIFPDMYYGRFSAQNANQLQNMLDKVLYYEKYEFSDPAYLNDITLIAGEDGTWNPRVGQPTINYGTENYFNTDHGFTTVNAYLNSYNGCYDNERFRVGMINYTAHCSETSWAGPTLTQSDVNNIDNVNKYPLAIGNCCLAADFGTSECIGETWMRKANGGSVAYIGSSPSSYWWEDYYWSVGAHAPVDGVHPTFEGSTIGAYDAPYVSDYLCVDALIFVGNLAVTEAHDQSYESSISTKYYWEAYNCLSDPSLFIYLTEGETNTVNHLPTVPIGVSEYEVTAVAGSYVAISKDGVLYGAALVPNSGTVTVPLTPITEGGNVDIVVTKSQYQPYTAVVPAAALEGPYLAIKSFTIVDNSGNGTVEYGETFNVDLTLQNVGTETAEAVTATLTTDDSYITSITQNVDIAFPNIAADGTGTVTGKFIVTVKDSVPDQHVINFTITINDTYTGSKQEYIATKTVTVNAPVLTLKNLTYNDNFAGNLINGILDAGETGEVIFEIENKGHAALAGAEAQLNLVAASEYLTLNTTMAEIGNLMVSPTVFAKFNVTAAANTPLEEHIPVHLTISGGPYQTVAQEDIVIGLIPIFVMGGTDEVVACTGTFFDSGDETGNYGNNEDHTITFKPSIAGNLLEFTFESFETESGYDYLYIYNGETASGEEIAGSPFHGTNVPSKIMASNSSGALTFKFTSDGYGDRAGWKATFECIDGTAAPLCAEGPSPTNGANGVYSTMDLSWVPVSGAVEYDIYFGETLPAQPTTTVNTNTYKVENLAPYTEYTWKVIPKNMNGDAPDTDCGSWTFTTGAQIVYMSTTSLTTCEAVFMDDGGTGEYANDQNTTITFMPGEANKAISVAFTEFSLEANYDYIEIFNGPTTTSPLIGKYDGTDHTAIGDNGTVTANNDQGSLTVHFYSDGLYTYSGWVANITCVDASTDSHTLTFNVTDAHGAIAGAVVTIGDAAVNTDATGVAEFTLAAGNYSYTVTADNHIEASGSVDISGADVTENVVMTIIGVAQQAKANLAVYPNPSNGKFTITGVKANTVNVFNTSGVAVVKENKVNNNVVELSNLEQGIYFIQVTTQQNAVVLKKISILK